MRDSGGNDPTKRRPDFSNVQSGSSSTAPAPATPTPEEKTYEVQKGDSLSKIAKREYGDAQQWRRIFEANRDQIKDPDLIHPGQKLRIPAAPQN
jgi:nucleoid-associated protein YgaU